MYTYNPPVYDEEGSKTMIERLRNGTNIDPCEVYKFIVQIADIVIKIIPEIENDGDVLKDGVCNIRQLTDDMLASTYSAYLENNTKNASSKTNEGVMALKLMSDVLYILYGHNFEAVYSGDMDDSMLEKDRSRSFMALICNSYLICGDANGESCHNDITPMPYASLRYFGIIKEKNGLYILLNHVKHQINFGIIQLFDDIIEEHSENNRHMNDDCAKTPMCLSDEDMESVVPQLTKGFNREADRIAKSVKSYTPPSDEIVSSITCNIYHLGMIVSLIPYICKVGNTMNAMCGIISLSTTIWCRGTASDFYDSKTRDTILDQFDKILTVKIAWDSKIPLLTSNARLSVITEFLDSYPHISALLCLPGNIFLNDPNATYTSSEEFKYFSMSFYRNLYKVLTTRDTKERARLSAHSEMDGIFKLYRSYRLNRSIQRREDDASTDMEDVRSGSRRVVKTVVDTKKKIDTTVEQKIKEPIIQNIDKLVEGVVGNEAASDKEKASTRVQLIEGRYKPSFLLKKIFKLGSKAGVAVMLGGPVVGAALIGFFAYLEVLRTKKHTNAERVRMVNELDDAIEVVNVRIESAESTKQKMSLIKIRQKIEAERNRIKVGNDIVKKKDK